ncbi:MAG: GNAT family N-acetyltransferase [Oscillospiraceae bacterium]
MTKIYLIRHAEAEGNLYRRAQGHFNSNVTPLGRRQIAALAERFRDVPLDALWSSDLNRTQSTAAAIRKYHPELALNLSERLREIDVGVWEDQPWGNLSVTYPEQMEYFTHDPARWSIPGGEPYEAVQRRIKAEVLSLAERYDGQTVAVVSHGLAIRSLLCDVFGIPSERIDTLPYGDNTSVTLLNVENGNIAVEFYNDASHLDAMGLSTFSRQTWREKSAAPGKRRFSRLTPLDPFADSELYTRCYAETWRCSHGNLEGYTPMIYLRAAQSRAKADPRCVMQLRRGEDFAGIIELDPERGQEQNAGWISLLYIEPSMRAERLGIQLIGHASSYFRGKGRSSLRLHVAQDNQNAVGFYEHIGFRPLGESMGVAGMLYEMEMDIERRILRPEEI